MHSTVHYVIKIYIIIILSRDLLYTGFDCWLGFIGLLDINAWLHFTFHYYTQTSVLSDVFTSRCLAAVSNCGRSLSSGFPNSPWPQPPASNNSSQRLSPSSPLTDKLSNQLNSYLVLPTTSRHGQHRKHSSSVAVYVRCLLTAVVYRAIT
jgi:hypothetical protein